MFPYSCDALLYHLPIVTGALIAVNILTFTMAMTEKIVVENGWLLEYGTGLHPEQWLLSAFMHANVEHLLGNMFFLWAFGLITEGKLGWWRFLLIYLGIAMGQSAIEQAVVPHLTSDIPFTVGASAAISGLMAMACIWAPINELSVFTFVGFRYFTFEMAVGVFAALFVGLDLVFCLMLGSGAIGSATHLMGGAMGATIGVALLKWRIVECEDYDLLSVFSGAYGSDRKKQREAAAITPGRVAAQVAEKALEGRRRFDAYLEINKPEEALAVKARMATLGHPLQLERQQLAKLVNALHKQKLWAQSAPIMAEFIQRFPAESHGVRLKLAQICLVELDKPARALELLAALDNRALPPANAGLRDKIRAIAQRKVAEGAVEIDDASW